MFDERMGLAGQRSADELRRRQQLGQEYQIQYNQPFQNLAAILSGAPMPGNPQFNPVPQTDYMGGVMNAYNAQAQAAAQRGAGKGSALSGLGSLAGTVIPLFSDDDIKENIIKIGTVGKNGIYEYNFIGDPSKTRYKGFLASQVEKSAPEAVSYKNGLRFVNYDLAVKGAMA